MCLYSQIKDGGFFVFLYFIFLEPWTALKWDSKLCQLVVTPDMSAAHHCFLGSGHQSSDPCLPLVITTAAPVLLTLLLPWYCVHCFVDDSFYHLIGEFALAGLRASGAVGFSWWLERWGAHYWEGGICLRRMCYVHLGAGLGKWGWEAFLLHRVIKPFLDR